MPTQNMTVQRMSIAVQYLIRGLFSPAVLIAVFTPKAIDAVNKVVLAAVQQSKDAEVTLLPLIDAVSAGSWACAALDVKIQVYATAVSFFIALVEWARHALPLWARIHNAGNRAPWSSRAAITLTVGVYGGAVYFLGALFVGISIILSLTPEFVSAYMPTCASSAHPPWTTLTMLRYSILIGTILGLLCISSRENGHRH